MGWRVCYRIPIACFRKKRCSAGPAVAGPIRDWTPLQGKHRILPDLQYAVLARFPPFLPPHLTHANHLHISPFLLPPVNVCPTTVFRAHLPLVSQQHWPTCAFVSIYDFSCLSPHFILPVTERGALSPSRCTRPPFYFLRRQQWLNIERIICFFPLCGRHRLRRHRDPRLWPAHRITLVPARWVRIR